jgi:DNA-binding Lrp family transcriptional regulator
MAQQALSSASAKILKVIQLDAQRPLQEISRVTKIPVHSIQYWIQKMLQSGTIRRGTVVNPLRIGESRFGFFFSLTPASLKNKNQLIRFLHTHERVIWFAELGSEFQFGLTLIARHGKEVQDFITQLEKSTSIAFSRTSLSLLNEFTIFQKSYLYPRADAKDRQSLLISTPSSVIEVDETDRKILSVINQATSHVDIMRRTGIARQTIDLRIQKLKQNEVILRDVFYISAQNLGFQVFRILIFLSNQQPQTWQRVMTYAAEESHIVSIGRCIGGWDGEITVEARSSIEVSLIVDQLAHKLGEDIVDLKIIPVLTQKTSMRTMGTKTVDSKK